MVLGNLISGFIVILVGVTLIPVLADQVVFTQQGTNASTATNVTGAASTLIGLTTLFFAIGIMAAGIDMAMRGLKNAGLV